MRPSSYARALYELVKAHPHEDDKLIEQFVTTVHRNGHAHLFSRIIKAYAKISSKDLKAGTITVLSATPMTEASVVELLKKEPFKKVLSTKHKKVVRRTDESIIGGVVVRSNTTRIDASYKGALIDIYQRTITNL